MLLPSFQPGVQQPGLKLTLPSGNPGIQDLLSLEQVGLVKPEIFNIVSNWYIEHTNPLTRLIMHFGGKMDLSSGTMNKGGAGMDDMQDWQAFQSYVSQNVKKIDKHQFAYNVPTVSGIMPYFTRDAIGERNAAGNFIGEITVFVSTDKIGVDETIALANFPFQTMLFVTRVEPMAGVTASGIRETKLTCRISTVAQSVSPALVAANQQFGYGYNIAPEGSTKGAKPKPQNGGANWVTNYITTMRYETGISGHAHNTRLDQKVFDYVCKDGNKYTFYIDYQRDLKYRQRVADMAQYILTAQRFSSTGEFFEESTNKRYFSGDGILSLTNPKLRRAIRGSVLDWIERQSEIMLRDDPNASTLRRAKYIITCPMNIANRVSQELGRTFNLNPEPLYFEEGGNRGVNAAFNAYRSASADYIFVGHNLFNSRNMPQFVGANGTNISNNSIYMMNASTYETGTPNFMLLQNREMIIDAKLQGMADAKSGQTISHSIDTIEYHDLLSLGVAVPNPNFLSVGFIL